MPFNLGIGEIIVVLVLALLIFGKRLPEVGRSLGRGILEFKEGLKGAAASLSDDSDTDSESTAEAEKKEESAEAPAEDKKTSP